MEFKILNFVKNLDMNKIEFLKEVSFKSNASLKDCKKIFSNAYYIICDCLKKGEIVNFYGFGKFYVKRRSERLIKSNMFLENKLLPPKYLPAFKIGKCFKEIIR